MKGIPELFDLMISLPPLFSTMKIPSALVPIFFIVPGQRDIQHLTIKLAFLCNFVIFITIIINGFIPHAFNVTRRKVVGLKIFVDLRTVSVRKDFDLSYSRSLENVGDTQVRKNYVLDDIFRK